MIYAITACVLAMLGFIVYVSRISHKGGVKTAEVADSRQKAVDATAEASRTVLMNNAANRAPTAKDDLIRQLQAGKEGQSDA